MTVSHRIVARVAGACTARLKWGTDITLSDGAFTGEQTITAAPLVLDVTLDGLTENTTYYARVETDGRLTGDVARFTTTPGTGAIDFSFVTGSCTTSLSNGAVWETMRALDPLFALHLGDMHYENPSSSSQATIRGYYDTKVLPTASTNQRRFWRNVPIEYIWDGHDCYVTDAPNVALVPGQAVYRQYVPHRTLEVSDGIYRAFTIGRVRFVVSDLYSHRTDAGATDDASKSLLGANQKAWWKNELADAWPVHGCPIVLWANSWPLNCDNTLRWGGYKTERAELADYVKAQGLEGRVFSVSGDDHVLEMDDGTNTDFATGGGGPIPCLQSAPMDQIPGVISTGIGINSDRTYTNGPFDGDRWFTLITIEDNGSEITMTWSGRSATTGVEQTSLVFVVPDPA